MVPCTLMNACVYWLVWFLPYNIICSFQISRNCYALNEYSKKLPVISSVEYKQVVRKVVLSEQYRTTEIYLSQSEASAVICLKKRASLKSLTVRNIRLRSCGNYYEQLRIFLSDKVKYGVFTKYSDVSYQ